MSKARMPHWGHVGQAFIDGAHQVYDKPILSEVELILAADAYAKRCLDALDPGGPRSASDWDWPDSIPLERPAGPPNRINLVTAFGSFWFESEAELATYRRASFWSRLTGRAYASILRERAKP